MMHTAAKRNLSEVFTAEGFKLTVLTKVKAQRFSEALGFLRGQPVGQAEGRGTKTPPHIWRHAEPALLPAGNYKDLAIRAARGSEAVGFWKIGSSGKSGAVVWRFDENELQVHDLHPAGYAKTYAMGCGGGMQVGVGEPVSKKGSKPVDVGLVWSGTASGARAVPSDGAEVALCATDGESHVGSVAASRAAMWMGDQLIVLGPTGKATMATGVGDGEQVGELWTQTGPHAVMWRGSETSLTSLHPPGYESSRGLACAGGLQVGFVKPREMTRAGFNAPEMRAYLWAGSAESAIDLHAVVPAPWNASVARAIEVDQDVVRIAGYVEQFVMEGDASSSSIEARQACIWEARLRG